MTLHRTTPTAVCVSDEPTAETEISELLTRPKKGETVNMLQPLIHQYNTALQPILRGGCLPLNQHRGRLLPVRPCLAQCFRAGLSVQEGKHCLVWRQGS